MSRRIIDLGLIGDDLSEIEVRPRGRLTIGHWRHSWPAAVLAVAILMATAAAAPPPPPRITPVLSAPGGEQAVLTERNLYVLSDPRVPDGGPRSATTLAAYDLGSSVKRWEVTYPGAVTLDVVDDVPLVSGWGTGRGATAALDPGSGALQWRHDGYPIGAVGELVLLSRFQAAGHRLTDMATAVTAVDLITGERRWRQQIKGLRSNVGPEHLATIAADGELRSYDVGSGELVATETVPGLTPTASVQVIDSQVLVRHARWQESTVISFDAATLQRQWTAALPGDTTPWACGRLICLIRDEQLHAIDRATGEPAWPSVTPEPFPRGPTVSYLTGSDRLLLTSASRRAPSWTVGAASGRTGEALSGWIRPDPRSIRSGTSADGGASPNAGSSAVLLRGDPDRFATWVGRLDPVTARLDVVGMVPDTLTPLCFTTADLLACRRIEQGPSIQVWRLR